MIYIDTDQMIKHPHLSFKITSHIKCNLVFRLKVLNWSSLNVIVRSDSFDWFLIVRENLTYFYICFAKNHAKKGFQYCDKCEVNSNLISNQSFTEFSYHHVWRESRGALRLFHKVLTCPGNLQVNGASDSLTAGFPGLVMKPANVLEKWMMHVIMK